jgi:ParB family chromosome partitioning protein
MAIMIQEVPIEKVIPSPFQVRKSFNEEDLKELAQTIKDHGLISPITVRPVNDGFELIAGERRLRAAKLLGWATILAKAEQVDDKEAAQLVLIENVQRTDLNPLEKAHGYKRLQDMGLTLETIAEKVGLSDKSTISRFLSILEMPQELQDLLPRGNIFEAHTRFIRQIQEKDQQIALAKQIDQEGLSVKETEKRVQQLIGKKPKAAKTPAEPVTDPLEDLWPVIQAGTTEAGFWEAKYGAHKMGGGQAVNGWFFFVMPLAQQDPKSDLAAWFKKMAEALMTSDLKPQASKSDGLKPTNYKVRLPQTPEEEAELLRIAETEGPQAVYTWIFGADSHMTKAVPFKTWEEAGMTAAEGLKKILDGVRQFQQMQTSK